jgi:hypothetical protein
MKPEDRLLFASCRQDFTEKYQKIISDLCQRHAIPWDTLFAKAEQHGVTGLVYINLCQRSSLNLGIPEAVADQSRMFTFRNTIWKEQRGQRLQQALEYFSARSLDVLLIKGGVLDLLVYEHPSYVTSNDTDLVIRCKLKDFEADDLQDLHVAMHGSGIEYDFFEHHDTTINGAIPIDFERIWDDARRIDYRGQSLLIMSPEDMLISLCINSCRKRFFRLKSLLDIAETIHRIQELRWDCLVDKAQAYDCLNIVYTALLITQRTLGCDIAEGVMNELTPSRARAALIRGISNFLLRWTSLPASPNAGRAIFGKQIHPSLLLPYAAYRGYQIRHKLAHEIF